MGVPLAVVRKLGYDVDYEYNPIEQAFIKKIDELYGLGYVYNNPDHLLTLKLDGDTLTYQIDTKGKWFKQVIKIKGIQSREQLKQTLVAILNPYVELATILETGFKLKIGFNKLIDVMDADSFLENKPQVKIAGVVDVNSKKYKLKVGYNNKKLFTINGAGITSELVINDAVLNHQKKARRITIFWFIMSPIIKTMFNAMRINGNIIVDDLFMVYYKRYYFGDEAGSGKLWNFQKQGDKTIFTMSR